MPSGIFTGNQKLVSHGQARLADVGRMQHSHMQGLAGPDSHSPFMKFLPYILEGLSQIQRHLPYTSSTYTSIV